MVLLTIAQLMKKVFPRVGGKWSQPCATTFRTCKFHF